MITAFRRLAYRQRFRRLLVLRRAWAQVLDSEDPDHVTRLASQMAKVPLALSPVLIRLLGVPKPLEHHVELCVRQYLLITILYRYLQPGLLLAVTRRRSIMPIPSAWRRWGYRQGLSISPARSQLAFMGLSLKHWMHGALTAWRLLRPNLRGLLPSSMADHGVFVRFPTPLLPGPHDNAETAFLPRYQAISGASTLWVDYQGVLPSSTPGLSTLPVPFPRLPSWGARTKFVANVIRLGLISFVALTIGRAWPALILKDLIELAYAMRLPPAALPKSYAFANSSWIHRPLFTYLAKYRGGCPSRLVFYSTNMDVCLQLVPAKAPSTFLPGYEIMTWDEYWAWDQAHADLIRAYGHDDAVIKIVGAMPRNDSGQALPDTSRPILAVFDVTPHHPARLASAGLVYAYYRDSVASAFLRDLAEVGSAAGYAVVVKQKRDVGRIAAPLYRATLRDLSQRGLLTCVDPGISAAKMAAAASIVVAYPYSSPALFRSAGRGCAAFYDPTGRLAASERQCHGLPLVRRREGLEKFLGVTSPQL